MDNHINDNGVRVIRSKRRTITLKVEEDASVILKVPLWTTDKHIDELIRKHAAWIDTKRKLMLKKRAEEVYLEFRDGEELYFLGQRYKLKRKTGARSVWLDSYFHIPDVERKLIVQMLRSWYSSALLDVIINRLNFFVEVEGRGYRSLRISRSSSKWGSCSEAGDLAFSWRLAMAPPPVIDYVIAHELAHLKVKDHSKKFWQTVESIMPGYEINKLWLRENGHLLKI